MDFLIYKNTNYALMKFICVLRIHVDQNRFLINEHKSPDVKHCKKSEAFTKY